MAALETLNDLVFHVRETSAGRSDLLAITRGESVREVSASDFLRDVHALAVALDDAGVERGERVAIWSENRPEWHVVDFACHLLGATTVPIFPGLSPERVAYVLRNSGARRIFYSDAAKRDRLREMRSGLTRPPAAVAIDGEAATDDGLSITRLIGEGARRLGDVPFERFRGRVEADEPASIHYTSGGDGEDSRGFALSHRNLVANLLAVSRVFPLSRHDRTVSFSSLAHVFQRSIDQLAFYRGARVHHVPKGLDLPRALAADEPTLLVAPPVVYQRIREMTLGELESFSSARRRLGRWALDVGARHAIAAREGFIGPILSLQRRLAERLFLREVRAAFGGRLRFAISGGEPLAEDVVRFFVSIGLPIYEGYGFTGALPVIAVNAPESHRVGSLGRPLPEIDLRIAEDGEILVRGPSVMRAYWQDPEATEAAMDDSGWFHTGDLGRVDKNGHVFLGEPEAKEAAA